MFNTTPPVIFYEYYLLQLNFDLNGVTAIVWGYIIWHVVGEGIITSKKKATFEEDAVNIITVRR